VFKISRQAVNCIAPEVREDLGEKNGKITKQVRQILLFLVYEIILKIDFNLTFYLKTALWKRFY
jgi:hypothetical protein